MARQGAVAAVGAVIGAVIVTACGPAALPDPPERGILGQVVTQGDQPVSTLAGPDTVGGGLVLAVPGDRFEALWEAEAREDPYDRARILSGSFLTSAEAVEGVGGALGPVDGEGLFTLDVDASGDYLVCYSGSTREGAIHAGRCELTTLTPPGRLRLHLGEGFSVESVPDEGEA